MERCRVKRPILLILIIAFCLVGCQGTDKKFFPYEISSRPYQKVVEKKQVFLAPFQLLTKNTENNKQYDRLYLSIKKYLETNGYEVLPPEKFVLAWNINRLVIGSLYDQKSGKISSVRLKDCLSKTIVDLKRKSQFSAVIVPTLTYKDLNLKGTFLQKVGWDGVERKTRNDDQEYKDWSSHVAVSLDVVIFSRNFSPVFKSRGGLGFIATNNSKKGSSFKQEQAIKDLSEAHILEAIEVAFYPFINSVLVEKAIPENYIKMVQRKLLMNLDYPKRARKKHTEGETQVRFTINSEGKANNITIVKSSGHKILDAAASKTIQKSSLFPKPPARFFTKDIVVELPLKFEKSISLSK